MANFCGKCGSKLVQGAKVCGNCGMYINSDTENKVVKNSNGNNILGKNTKIVKRAIKVVTVILLAVVLFKAFNYFLGYESVVRKTVNVYKTYDIEKAYDMMSELYSVMDKDDVTDFLEMYMVDVVDDFEYEFGADYKVSYEINNEKTLSKRQVESFLENSFYIPKDEDNILKEVVFVDVTIIAEGKRSKQTVKKEVQMAVSKEGIGWKLLFVGNRY